MIPRLLFPCLAAAILLSSGCMFSKKNRKPKEDSAIATDVEQTFKRRWLDQRVAELVASGVAADAAQVQASREFGEKFEFNTPRKK